MDKIVFLATLAGKLTEYQMPADVIEDSVAQVKVMIDRVSDEEFASDPATDEDVAAIAGDLYEKYLEAKKAHEEAVAAAEPDTKAEADAELYRRQQEAAAVLAMKRAEAEGMRLEAEGRKALNEAIGENLIRWQTVQNLDKIRFPHINVGSEAITPLLQAIKAVQNQPEAPQQ